MTFSLLSASATSALLIVLTILLARVMRSSLFPQSAKRKQRQEAIKSFPEPPALCQSLAFALPGSVIFPRDHDAFTKSMNDYWAQQECEVPPACVVRPRNTEQLCTATKIIKDEYDNHTRCEGVFAVRSGGHSPVPGAATIKAGVLIDLSGFNEVALSEDETTVVIGAGAKWMDVSKVLDPRNLAVVGGRNSAVGVGGLILGGGLSFFSPRFGLVCSNIHSYEVVLASGTVVTASASVNSDLWRALKGGTNNFGIVTHFTARSFPSTKIWSGFLYLPGSSSAKVLAAFQECVNRANSNDLSITDHSYPSGPIACFSYVRQLGIQAIAVNLVHTKPELNNRQWPAYWSTTPFASLWRLWSTCKVRTLTSATDEMNALNPPGRRQLFATTTIKNDAATLAAAHAAYLDATSSIRTVKGLVWTLVLQPLLPSWIRKDDENILGFENCPDEALVLVSFTINWTEAVNDDLIKKTTQSTIEQIDSAATANGTSHKFRYLNYCAEWQKPFDGYGEQNLRFLQGVSRKYDPKGLFQKGCVGGFKLPTAGDDA